jgi:hypothetical protein
VRQGAARDRDVAGAGDQPNDEARVHATATDGDKANVQGNKPEATVTAELLEIIGVRPLKRLPNAASLSRMLK